MAGEKLSSSLDLCTTKRSFSLTYESAVLSTGDGKGSWVWSDSDVNGCPEAHIRAENGLFGGTRNRERTENLSKL